MFETIKQSKYTYLASAILIGFVLTWVYEKWTKV